MMKKRFLFVTIATICLVLVACQRNNNGGESSATTPDQSSDNVPSSSEQQPEQQYSITRPEFNGDYDTHAATPEPFGLNMTYYSDIYSRGFAWFTDKTPSETKLYLTQSDKGKDADFSNATLIEGTSLEVEYNADGNCKFKDGDKDVTKKGSSNDVTLNLYSHKVHVENLEKGKAYSYKLGAEQGWSYGAFIVEKEAPKTITAVHMSDAQTKDLTKLNVWRNTFTKAVDTAGKDLDLALYNGDQFDQNNATGNNKKPSRVLRYTKALDVIRDYKSDIPYMASSGNHEPSVPYINYFTGDINYPSFKIDEKDYYGYSDSGCYYSYDYNFAHFAVLNTNDVSTAQIEWLKSDLDAASNAKWKIVMMHISPYSTGDHTNKSDNQKIVEKLTPVFSEKHVDLVLQAHDHTYNKTLPYKWDAAGYTTTYNNTDVVNLNPETETKDNIVYDKNPQGTYYVTTGAAGHRCGAPEATDGVWAEVVKNGEQWEALDSSFTYLNNKYKIEMGTIKYSNTYEPYTAKDDNKKEFTSAQSFEVGHLATGCVNAQMFGVLNLSESTMSYNVYTVNGETVKLFDSLDVLKA